MGGLTQSLIVLGLRISHENLNGVSLLKALSCLGPLVGKKPG